nr:unnamed protein product [Digitaria exilis]
MTWRLPPCPSAWSLVFFLGSLSLLAQAVHGAGTPPTPSLPPAEVRVLSRIKAKLGVSNWDFAAGLCDYGSSGVHCDCSFSNGTVCHVTEIFLKEQNFSSELPPDFAEFPNLLQLDLSRNLFHGGVPDQWARMKLQGLSLMGNRLSGPFPMVITKITTLTNLSIEGNEFHGPIPPEIGGLIRMEKLILSANEFTGPLPTALSLFSNLTDLRISGTNFSGRMPDFLGKLKRLEKLQIEGSLLEGPIPLSLSELTNLFDLRISDLRGTGSAFPDFSRMQSMKTMILRKCSISGSLPSYIGSWTTLKHLDLSFNKLNGEIPPSFANMQGVDYIYLTGNSLTGNIPGWLLRRNKIANFDAANKIGEGGFGSVYKGSLSDGTIIAVKQLSSSGYMAPEYAMRGYLTDKADVYSFGAVALEVVSGKSNTNYRPKEDFVYLLDWACVLHERGTLLELVDPDLGTNYSTEEALLMLNVALLCTTAAPTLRPKMSKVVSLLEGHSPLQPLLSDLSLATNSLSSSGVRRNFWQNPSENQSLKGQASYSDTNKSSTIGIDGIMIPLVS